MFHNPKESFVKRYTPSSNNITPCSLLFLFQSSCLLLGSDPQFSSHTIIYLTTKTSSDSSQLVAVVPWSGQHLSILSLLHVAQLRHILRAGLTRQVEVWLAIGLQSVTQAIGGHNPQPTAILPPSHMRRVSIIEADFGLSTQPMACQLYRVFFKLLCTWKLFWARSGLVMSSKCHIP